MKGYFFPDFNHEAEDSIRAFRNRLPELWELGVKVVYLEFQYRTSPTDWDSFESAFVYCSGGRALMARAYFAMAQEARERGFEVIGLSREGYFQLTRTKLAIGWAFRTLLPFDGLAAITIEQTCASRPFVVFLGSAHWPLLGAFLPTLVPVLEIKETSPDPRDTKNHENIGNLSAAIKETQAFGGDAYADRVGAQFSDGQRKAMTSVAWDNPNDTLEQLLQKAQDKTGVPPTLLHLNYILARRLSPNIIWGSRLVTGNRLVLGKK